MPWHLYRRGLSAAHATAARGYCCKRGNSGGPHLSPASRGAEDGRLAVSPRHGELLPARPAARSPSSLLTSWPATHPQADVRFVLLETAMGYLLFERKESDEIGATLPEVQAAVKDYGKFSLVLKLKAQFFFRTAEEALANINDISEGIVTPSLKVHRKPAHPWHSPRDVNPSPPTQAFLEPNVPAGKAGKKAKVAMGVSEHGACPLPCSKCCTIAHTALRPPSGAPPEPRRTPSATLRDSHRSGQGDPGAAQHRVRVQRPDRRAAARREGAHDQVPLRPQARRPREG